MTLRISTRWQIVGALFAMMMFSSGLGFYNQSVLLEALTRERGFSVFSASFASTVFFATSGFMGLAVASLIERIDARWSVAAGVAVCAASLVAIGRVETILEVYAAFIVFGIGFSATNMLTASTLITRWFARRRALALSIVFTGLSAGGIVVAPFAAWAVAEHGLGRGTEILAATYVLGILPLALWRLLPQPRGETDLAGEFDGGEDPGVGAREAFRSRYFAGIAVTFFFGLMAQVGGIAHQFKLVSAYEPDVAGRAVAVLAAASVVGRLASGALLERLPYRGFALAMLVLQGVTLFVLGSSTTVAGLLIASGAFGLTIGSFLMMQPLLLAEAFGTRSFARIYSVSTLCASVGVALGPLLLGWAHDFAGGYRNAYALSTGLSWLGCVSLWAAGRGYVRAR
ncbi:MAG: MFS transporter [Acidobacteria bacterium]|nr:MFS transporter [Acidobacteriota bacterium]